MDDRQEGNQNDHEPQETPEQETPEQETPEQETSEPAPDSGKYQRKLLDWGKKGWQIAEKALSEAPAALARLREEGGKSKIKEDIQGAFGHIRPGRIASLLALVLAALYTVSGVYIVNPGEEAVERLFGRIVGEGITEGMHYRLPWPFQQVDKVNVSEVQREGVGFLLPEHEGVHSSPDRLQILTGDENIVDVRMVIQYRITDPSKYLFEVDFRSYQIINDVVRSAVTSVGSNMLVDEILTVAKEEINRLVQAETQRLLDAYETGLTVLTVNIDQMYPPDEVADAFRDVAGARVDSSRTISQAEGYRNSVLPPAKGEAERMLREAEGYEAEVIDRAQGETQRFLQMLAEYRETGGSASPDVTRERLYLETMEKILPRTKKYILSSDGGGKINLRFFGKKQD